METDPAKPGHVSPATLARRRWHIPVPIHSALVDASPLAHPLCQSTVHSLTRRRWHIPEPIHPRSSTHHLLGAGVGVGSAGGDERLHAIVAPIVPTTTSSDAHTGTCTTSASSILAPMNNSTAARP